MHLVGGPRTIETYRALGALDKLERALPGGSVEIVYGVA